MTTKEFRGRHGRLEVERQVIEIQCADRIEADQFGDVLWDSIVGKE